MLMQSSLYTLIDRPYLSVWFVLCVIGHNLSCSVGNFVCADSVSKTAFKVSSFLTLTS